MGFGCTTCIGNSGPLPENVSKAINDNDLVACSVLSGNRNFEGRVNPDVRANYLASPPLVVAYALAGSMLVDLANDPLGTGADGKPVYLKTSGRPPSRSRTFIDRTVTSELFATRYADVFTGDANWKQVTVSRGSPSSGTASTYVQNLPYFEGMTREPKPSRTSSMPASSAFLDLDHHRPHLAGGNIRAASPAGKYLQDAQVASPTSTSTGRGAATTRS